MDNGESGMKEPPVIVQILLKRISVRNVAHTVIFSREELCSFLVIHLDHIMRIKLSVMCHRTNIGVDGHTDGWVRPGGIWKARYNSVFLVGTPGVRRIRHRRRG